MTARAYDTVLDHVGDESMLDLVRRDLSKLEQELTWTLTLSGPPTPGDFDGSGLVDANDLVRWEAGLGLHTTATVAQGDADTDADVDGRDFLLWQRHHSGQLTAAASVPEPANLGLLAMALVTVMSKRMKRFRS